MDDGGDQSSDQGDGNIATPIAAGVVGGHDLPMHQVAVQSIADGQRGRVDIAGFPLSYRVDRRQAWSYLDMRWAALARPTGKYIRLTPAHRRASEKVLQTPWGELRVLLWDLCGAVDLVAGREALGGPSPSPWRRLSSGTCAAQLARTAPLTRKIVSGIFCLRT